MTTLTCPKCQYQRQPSDTAPDWQCPSCQIAYSKYKAPTTAGSATAYPIRNAGSNDFSEESPPLLTGKRVLLILLIAAGLAFWFGYPRYQHRQDAKTAEALEAKVPAEYARDHAVAQQAKALLKQGKDQEAFSLVNDQVHRDAKYSPESRVIQVRMAFENRGGGDFSTAPKPRIAFPDSAEEHALEGFISEMHYLRDTDRSSYTPPRIKTNALSDAFGAYSRAAAFGSCFAQYSLALLLLDNPDMFGEDFTQAEHRAVAAAYLHAAAKGYADNRLINSSAGYPLRCRDEVPMTVSGAQIQGMMSARPQRSAEYAQDDLQKIAFTADEQKQAESLLKQWQKDQGMTPQRQLSEAKYCHPDQSGTIVCQTPKKSCRFDDAGKAICTTDP